LNKSKSPFLVEKLYQQMKILVVDDETDVKDLFLQKFRKEIRENKMAFEFAYSSEEALQYLKNNPQEAVLILSDINMPQMSGLELLKVIKSQNKVPPPVIMMITAYGDELSKKTAFELGADDFLSKPLDFISLKEKLTQHHE
jgi:two-component system, chemotaxis family, chemotaxis protein CheY